MRYVVALLLVRRRVFRLEEDDRASGGEVLRLHCPRRDATYEVPVVIPDPAQDRRNSTTSGEAVGIIR